MKNELMKICMSSLYEIDVTKFEDALTLKTWWNLWNIENKAQLGRMLKEYYYNIQY